uniref:Protein kinase domain-containing protein n=1 Tax=Ananas comosus var. bracteatus TaxID=296719 RepID=A0A6V7QRG0_ANACO
MAPLLLPPPLTKTLTFPSLPPLNPPNPHKKLAFKCRAVAGNSPEEFLLNTLHLGESNPLFPILRYSFAQFEGLVSGLTEVERWEVLVFVGLSWVYLTARPGVLVGAIDAYLLAPLQLGLDGLLGKRNLKMSDFVVGERLGEGSFGVVYAGAIVERGVGVEERAGEGEGGEWSWMGGSRRRSF